MALRRSVFFLALLVATRGFAPLGFPGRSSIAVPTASVELNDSEGSEFSRISTPVIIKESSSLLEKGLILSHQENGSTTKKDSSFLVGFLRAKLKRVRAALRKPGMKFRVRLGLVAAAAISIASLVVPQKRLFLIVQKWIAHRGFQGLAAFGRSVAYGWALLVAYPRMLDRRANERRKQEKVNKLEQRRKYLRSLAKEVVRLRQELSSIDGEIRAFRREIISLKAYANKEIGMDADVQEGISNEMVHLAQLRANTQAALLAARHTWSEVRSKSPSDAWEDDFLAMGSS
jgi:signal transduction histidine kinase